LREICVQAEGLDAGGNFLVGGSATVLLTAHRTTLADVQMSNAFVRCAAASADLLPPEPADLGGAPDDGGAADLAVPICPAGSLFCDDFESDNLSKWTASGAKADAGSVTVQSATVAHGSFALRALGNGAPGADVYAEAEKDFTATAPPFALRANVFFPAPLAHFDHVLALYESNSSTVSFAIGGDTDGNWVVSENESMGAPDRHSDMVPTGAGAWHCVELVIDAAGNVTLFVDNHTLIGPWARATATTYSSLLVGVVRSVDTDFVVYIDDVAIGRSRLYCPQ
jgi:hypothetical protein